MHAAKILAITSPQVKNLVTGEFLTPEEFITYCARVSNPSNQNNHLTSEKLLQYCIKNKHWSVFEMVNVVMEINTTRDIARQILRHRSFSFQEFSQRYADPTKDLGWTMRDARLQDQRNRQNSIETEDNKLMSQWNNLQDQIMESVTNAYSWAIAMGIAKEQARVVLPEGLMNSRMYMNGTLRSWIHYCDLRTTNGTQKEHRMVAQSALDELKNNFKFL
jgi:thymidylate synthase (FAD)